MREEKNSILYVDDEENNLIVFKSIFKYDYRIFTATSAKEGLEILRQHRISLVITDQRMPEINGVEFLKNALKEFPEIARIMLTGYSDLESISAAINECGIFRYLTKPWNEPDMKLAIDKALETFKLQRDVEQLIGKLEEANRDLEEKVKSRTADLIKLNEEKDHLIAIVAHDLKSPLNNLTGLVSILEKDSNNLNTKQRYYLTLIKQLHDKMAGMINRILHTESIEKAKLEVSPQITHIKQMMESQVRHFHDQASAKNITLISETGEEDTTLFLDQDLLNQILDNLISNAIKFSPARKRVYVRLHNTGDTVKIEVEDEGPGIRKDEQDKLFVKYKKLSAAPTNNESSTGLGLSLVKKYVELMEGKVWCESEEGKGAKFIVVFPVEPLPA